MVLSSPIFLSDLFFTVCFYFDLVGLLVCLTLTQGLFSVCMMVPGFASCVGVLLVVLTMWLGVSHVLDCVSDDCIGPGLVHLLYASAAVLGFTCPWVNVIGVDLAFLLCVLWTLAGLR